MSKSDNQPLIPATTKLPELTFKAIVISIILAMVLAASNAYLALKIGVTIAASIPASVLALGILRFFKTSNVLECNIIQTSASAGEGVAAAIAFILPAMIVLHAWHGFEFWKTFLVSILGGLLGVLFSIPLRRVMLNMPTLPFPEGTAIGNVLITSTKKGGYLHNLVYGGLAGSLISLCQTGFKFLAANVFFWRFWGNSLIGISVGLTPATLAAGYIIGFQVGVTLLVGIVVGWVITLPILAHVIGVNHNLSAYQNAMNLWTTNLRFIGVGNMIVGGVWTLLTLIKPVINGVQSSFRELSKKSTMTKGTGLLRTEQDISFLWVVAGTIFFSLVIYIFLTYEVLHADTLQQSVGRALFVSLCSLIYVVIIGFLLSTICGYFTGLVGSSNNPLSGILIIALLILSLMFAGLFDVNQNATEVAALVILIATVVASIAAISNENLQDLKAGKMVGATPWKQQVMLGVGVIASSIVIGPVLDLLFQAYGIAGVYPREGMSPAQMLAAPQASLMAAVVNGVLLHKLDWTMVLIGGGIAVVIIIIDEYLKRRGHRLPALAVGLGVYLPPEITTPIIIGGFVKFLVQRVGRLRVKTEEDKEIEHDGEQRGVLMACGMVAGSALMGVILAIPFVIIGSSDALNFMPASLSTLANWLGVIAVLALCVWFYRVARFKSR